MSIADNIRRYHEILPPGVELVAVSKFHTAEAIMQAYEAGQKLFGESRVQELLEKEKLLPGDIKWHFIGHLQTNKVKALVGKAFLIESIDSEKLLSIVDKESEKAGIVTNVLLQVHVAAEETKFGFYPEELLDFFRQEKNRNLKSTKICGLMGMATNTDDENRIAEDFHRISSLFTEIKEKYAPDSDFERLSMGMSGDWPLAVKEGANIVRIGSAIFGQRYYPQA